MKKAWRYLFVEPFTWIIYCLFFPKRFKRELAIKSFSHRIVPMFRLLLPMMLVSTFISIIFLLIFSKLFSEFCPQTANLCAPVKDVFVVDENFFLLVINTVWAATLGISWGVVWGIARGISWGILLGIMWGVTWGITWSGSQGIASEVAIGFTLGIIIGCGGTSKEVIAGIIAWSIIWAIPLNIKQGIVWVTASSTIALDGGIVLSLGVASSVVLIVVIGFIFGLIRSLVESLMRRYTVGNIRINITKSIGQAIRGGVIGSFGKSEFSLAGGVTLGLILGLLLGFLDSGFLSNTFLNPYLNTVWLLIGLLGFLIGSSYGIVFGAGFILSFTISIPLGHTLTIPFGYSEIVVGSIAFIISCNLGLSYPQLLIYPISAISSYRAYLACKVNPQEVFNYLHHSSLYWDESCSFPLPGLRPTLITAGKENIDRALEELAFIAAERPQQVTMARAALLGIVVNDLERRDNLYDIAQAFQQLTKIFSPEVTLNNPQWIISFTPLNEASRDAARYCSPLGWNARRKALEDMIANLQRLHSSSTTYPQGIWVRMRNPVAGGIRIVLRRPPNSATSYTGTKLNDRKLGQYLGIIANKWKEIAYRELVAMEKSLEMEEQIENPYAPGPVLELSSSLFVGRQDLVRQLEEALSRGSRRPTFILNGERRMGKSSTLKQLPNLLGARYLPIFYDLQNRGVSSSAAVFLGSIAEEIHEVMRSRGIRVKNLEYISLKEAAQENEASVYWLFNIWFKDIERILEERDRTLLLVFDEFEKLEEAGKSEYLNLPLLLDWFRSVIQNHPRLALLFSGVQTFGEMGEEWATYFVNVQTLKVSFLRAIEARQLITKPTPFFQGEQFFEEDVINEIMRVTGCHPFLVQAVCAALIDQLNADNRTKAELQDVVTSVDRVLENWWDTYFRDLWERTNQVQRICLATIKDMGTCTLQDIVQPGNSNAKVINHALQMLLKRDLVLLNNGSYSISTPIFCEWVERNL